MKNNDYPLHVHLLRKPHLLIFDEATSSLDSLTEEEITNTIKRYIFTMRPDHHSDCAPAFVPSCMPTGSMCLEKGDVVETGTHETLLEEKGLYYAMWRQQIGERKKEMAAIERQV